LDDTEILSQVNAGAMYSGQVVLCDVIKPSATMVFCHHLPSSVGSGLLVMCISNTFIDVTQDQFMGSCSSSGYPIRGHSFNMF